MGGCGALEGIRCSSYWVEVLFTPYFDDSTGIASDTNVSQSLPWDAVVHLRPQQKMRWCACTVASHSCGSCVCIGVRIVSAQNRPRSPVRSKLLFKLRPNLCTESQYKCNGYHEVIKLGFGVWGLEFEGLKIPFGI